MVGLTDYFNIGLLNSVLDRCTSIINAPLGFISPDGTFIARKNIPSYSTSVEQNMAEDFKVYRRIALENDQKTFNYPDGTEAILSPVEMNGTLIGAIVLGPFMSKSFDVMKACRMAKCSIADIELVIESMAESKQEYMLAAEIISKAIFPLLNAEKKDSTEIRQLQIVKEVSEAINSSLDINEMMRALVRTVKNAFYANDCSVMLCTGASYSHSGDLRKKNIETILFNSVKARRNMLIIKNMRSDILFSGIDVSSIKDEVVVAAPLLSHDSCIGVLIMYINSDKYGDKTADFFSILAAQAAVAASNAQQHSLMEQMAVTDGLTGLYNRAYLFQFLEESYGSAGMYSIALLDVDDFRAYNNTNGHPAGDKLLKELARLISETFKGKGVAARYGGEEFIVAVPMREPAEVQGLLSELKQNVAQHNFANKEKQPSGTISVSIGLVICKDMSLPPIELVKKADEALYRAKSTGKNRICTTIIIHKALSEVKVE